MDAFDLNIFEIKSGNSGCKCHLINDPLECIALQRMLTTLKYYSLLHTTQDENDLDIFTAFIESTYNQQLLDDYTHIMTSHDSNFESIRQALISNNLFDLQLCTTNFPKTPFNKDSNNSMNAYMQTLNDLHDAIFHTFNIEKQICNNEDDYKLSETPFEKLRREWKPRVPDLLKALSTLKCRKGHSTTAAGSINEIKRLFTKTYGQQMIDIIQRPIYTTPKTPKPSNDLSQSPLKVGVFFSGGPASGGHNVICALFDALKEMNHNSTLIGFIGGPKGLVNNSFIELTASIIDQYRNSGGFDMIQSGRYKGNQQKFALKTVNENNLDGLVIIGGDGSNSNAAVLAEYFAQNNSKCVVVGIPKTIDGDLQNEFIEVSFGFDTAIKTFSAMISNICRDAKSAAKAWHFIKLMGRDASQVTLECALNTQPNITLIGEEIQSENMLIHDIVENMVDIIEERALKGKNYGVCLIPEGVIRFIPSMKALINFLNITLKEGTEAFKQMRKLEEVNDKIKFIRDLLKASSSPTNLANFDILPRDIQSQLLLERDPNGNIQLSQIQIEKLFIMICHKKLQKRKKYQQTGAKFHVNTHFFGYDGRCCYPSNFDAQYCYALGRVGALLIEQKCNGYMARVYDLEKDVSKWKAGGVPITSLMDIEIICGKPKAVIEKCLVNVEDGVKFEYFVKHRDQWAVSDCYKCMEPIQYLGDKVLTDKPPLNVLFKKCKNIKWPIDEEGQ